MTPISISTMPQTTLYLLALYVAIAFAIPLDGTYGTGKNLTHLATRQGGNVKPASFKIDNWSDMAEENCYIMLCEMDGKRVL